MKTYLFRQLKQIFDRDFNLGKTDENLRTSSSQTKTFI